MATYYIGADVHVNNTELAVEYRREIVQRYSVPTSIPAISAVLSSLQGQKFLAIEKSIRHRRTVTCFSPPIIDCEDQAGERKREPCQSSR